MKAEPEQAASRKEPAMNWKFLPAALVGSVLVVGGCSSSRVDPASKQKAAESADMLAMKQDNEYLRQDQAQSQKQIETLTKQLAADREEQRRFREMMSTNFDLLEQSVSMTLSKSIDKGDKGAPPAAPAGSVPGASAGEDGSHGTANARTSKATAATPRLAPVPAVGASPSPSGYTPLVVPNGIESDEMRMAAPKSDPRMTAQTDSRAPLKVRSSAAPAAASAGAPQAVAPKSPAMPAAASKSSSKPAVAALVASDSKPYQDPDLEEPANPRQLSANRAAKSLYEKGFVLFGNRQYEQSILVYQNFLSRYPDDIYSDNAQFWIGEAYLRMDKLNEAEAAYRKVLREYAHKSTLEGYKTPDAIYRIGQIFAKRANDKLAKYYLQHVAQHFPESSAGRKAQRELEGSGPMTSQAGTGEFTTGG
jgi:tol-pal system protein YbgF